MSRSGDEGGSATLAGSSASRSQVADAYDRAAAHYDAAFRTHRDLAEADHVKRIMLRLGAPNWRHILDLGCGTGLYLDLFPGTTAGSYAGVDISSEMIRIAREKHPAHNLFAGDMNLALARQPNTWDAIVSLFAPLNYAEDPAGTLALARGALKEGGTLLTLTYAEGYADSHARIIAGLVSDVPSRYFSVADLVRIYRSAGFASPTVRSFHSGFGDAWPKFVHTVALQTNERLRPRDSDRFHVAWATKRE